MKVGKERLGNGCVKINVFGTYIVSKQQKNSDFTTFPVMRTKRGNVRQSGI